MARNRGYLVHGKIRQGQALDVAVTHHAGGTTITGDHIKLFHMKSQLSALGLELKGLKMSGGRSIYAHIKRVYGLRGNKRCVHDQFVELIEEYHQGLGTSS